MLSSAIDINPQFLQTNHTQCELLIAEMVFPVPQPENAESTAEGRRYRLGEANEC